MANKITSAQIVAQEAWIAPTLVNSFVNFGTPYSTAGYMKDSLGFVHLRGMVKTGASGATIFTLPAGYRPGINTAHYFAGVCQSGHADLVVADTGTVTGYGTGVPIYVSLSGVTFKAEA